MDIERRMDLVLRNTEEIVTREELHDLLETNSKPKAYWGFECSGLMHVGIGLIPGTKIRDMIEACLLYTSPSPRDRTRSRMPSSA